MASEEHGNGHNGPAMHAMSGEADAEEWRTRIENIVNALPPPSIQPLPWEHQSDLSKYKTQLGTPAEAWQKCAEVMKKCDADMCKAYREEIDTLLVFAGLFSAVVTAFTIESYQWLKSDPNDAVIALLSQIAQPANQTQTVPAPAWLPEAASARINAYWFLSLTLGLSAGLTAILCKQWVREFERHSNQSHDQFISVRQTKLEGFEAWGAGSVVAAVPLLLQSALGLFALGLIDLLWNLHVAVAIVVLIPAFVALVFYAATTVLPALQVFGPFTRMRERSQCPYKSPQAMLTLRTLVFLSAHLHRGWRFCRVRLGYLAELVRRKCLVFLRRMRMYWRPDFLPYPPQESLPASRAPEADHRVHRRIPRSWRTFWSRMVRPWQYKENVFYCSWNDRRSWGDWRSCWHRHRPTASETLEFKDNDHLVRFRIKHGSKALESWIMLDRHFTKCKDSAYLLRMANKDASYNPPAACFRGLAWLRRHTDQPDLPQWTWLVVWDIAMHIAKKRVWHRLSTSHLEHGIDYLTPGGWLLPQVVRVQVKPLIFGPPLKIKPAFIAELFVHSLPGLTNDAARVIWAGITLDLGSDDEIWHSSLRAILAHSATAAERRDISDFRPLLDVTVILLQDRLQSLSLLELAGLIALYFREQRSRGLHCVETGSRYILDLLNAALQMLAVDERSESGSLGLTPVFSELAYAFDSWLARLGAQLATRCVPPALRRRSVQRVYFDLLSAHLGAGLPAAKDRLARHLDPQLGVSGAKLWLPPSLHTDDAGSSSPASYYDAAQSAPGDAARSQPDLALNAREHDAAPVESATVVAPTDDGPTRAPESQAGHALRARDVASAPRIPAAHGSDGRSALPERPAAARDVEPCMRVPADRVRASASSAAAIGTAVLAAEDEVSTGYLGPPSHPEPGIPGAV